MLRLGAKIGLSVITKIVSAKTPLSMCTEVEGDTV